MQSRAATAPTANKREERRIQMLSKQRQRLEEEVQVLESEILALVRFVARNYISTLTLRNSRTKTRHVHDGAMGSLSLDPRDFFRASNLCRAENLAFPLPLPRYLQLGSMVGHSHFTMEIDSVL